MDKMTTGLRAKTFENLQLNAGMFLTNFEYSSASDSATLAALLETAITEGKNLLGATIGGGTFVATPTYRQVEVDGMRAPFKGSEMIDGWEIKLTTTMKEITADGYKNALNVVDKSGAGGKTTLKFRNHVKPEDYIENLVWVGDTSKGFVLISIKNALNTAGATLTFTDKGEGSIPVEFMAHQDGVGVDDYAPCEVIFFEPAV